MKNRARAFQPIAVIGIGLLLAVTSAAVSHPLAASPGQGAAALSLQTTATSVSGRASEIGSTDWIMLMSIIIVLIVIVPILLRRRFWTR